MTRYGVRVDCVLRQTPMLKCEPTWRPKKAAAVGVATNSSARDGSAARPSVMVTRSCRAYSPSSLAISSTWARSTLSRPPLGVSVSAPYELAQLTRFTWGRRAICEMKPEVHDTEVARLHQQVRRVGPGQERRVRGLGAPGPGDRRHGHAADQPDEEGDGQVAGPAPPERGPESVPDDSQHQEPNDTPTPAITVTV